MGGLSYSRDVYGSSSGWGSSNSSSPSSVSRTVMSANKLDASMHPCDRIITSKSKHPIIVFIDVTGSNTDFARIIYDKAPMFYGQIEQHGYFDDFELSFCAVGDAHSDKYPLQISDFAKGIEVDSWLKKIVLEGAGGAQKHETYELAAYYLLNNFKFEPDAVPVVFFLGDEMPYDTIPSHIIRTYIHSNCQDEIANSSDVFGNLLKEIPNTYMFLNPYNGYHDDDDIYNKWANFFGKHKKHIIRMQPDNEKSIVDLMLGIIALIGENDLDTYKIHMIDRGQSNERISSVMSSLDEVSTELAVVNSASVSNIPVKARSNRSNLNNRL